jgi:outer membrane protein OmpA-like peptidoglycan-associated protein
MNNQVGWNRAMKTSDFLCNTLHYPSDRVFFGFRENDTTNRVILTCVTESELPSKPAPHPNLRNRDTISRDTLTVHFGVNQSSLSGASDSIIDEYIRKIGGTRQLHIAGYCDNTGPEAYNDKLSLNRAQTVNNYLRQHWPDSIINTNLTAYGTRYPIDDNSTASGRARNRRVTIIAAQPRSATQPPAASAQPATTQTKGSIYNALTDTTTRTGTTIVLKDVVFYGGRRIPLPASYIALGELLKAMTDNTNLRIRIEGHVCCIPDSTDGPDLDTGQPDLSVQRAKFVFDYLLKQGIPENRLAYIGLGGSGKRYPEELNPAQQSANRRVEIRIMSK